MKTWRYSVPNLAGEGWAVLFLDEGGCFSALSDWGNVAYRWNQRGLPEGVDFRQFLLECDADYITRKLGQNRTEYDPDATKESIRQFILNRRRDSCGDRARVRARDEWDLVDDMGDSMGDFERWVENTDIDDTPSEFYCTRFVNEVTSFMKHAWPRLREVIAQDLKENP
jgi:hypothetical protein